MASEQAVTEAKPKTSTFPLDQILPIFKLNLPVEPAQPSNFVPTLKMR